MAIQNIQIGIDLGTTNSESAISNGGKIEIVKNVWGDDYTPSVFGFDKSENKIVGKNAYEKLFKDSSPESVENYKSEIKRLMGTSEVVNFTNGKAKMNAEEISSEILKSLREDIQRNFPEINSNAAVITVPAYFSILQKEATLRAGKLAGFAHVILLQEPISAAMSYGFSNNKDENVIVYDLGGGTFDVAVVSSKEGVLSVITQNGDNFLGGKDIDNIIIDQIIVTKIKDTYPELKNFKKSQEKYNAIFNKLKYLAEKAKIELTQLDKTYLEIDITDPALVEVGGRIELGFEISRSNLEKLIKPIIARTIDLTTKAIEESGLKKASIARVVLVGGPTKMPVIKSTIEKEIGIQVDTSSDPITAVARGAAVFGLGQKIPSEVLEVNRNKGSKEILLDISYDGLTSDDEQLIVGKTKKHLTDGYFLQIQSDSGYFNSPKIPIKDDRFRATVKIEPNKSNLYWLYLTDPKGNQMTTNPDSIQITHGITVSSAQLSHSVGFAIQSGINGQEQEMDLIFKKGDRLPLNNKRTYHTTHLLRKNDKSNSLDIILYEGESNNPDNNIYIADTSINGKELPFDIPEGTEIDITLNIDESNVVTVDWYIPLIDKFGDFRATLFDLKMTVDELRQSLERQRQKSIAVKSNCSETEKHLIDEKLISISKSIDDSTADADSKRKAISEIKELGQTLEELENSKELPQLEKDFSDAINDTRQLIAEIGLKENTHNDTAQLSAIEKEGLSAIEKKDKLLISNAIEQAFKLAAQIVWSNPQMWAQRFNELKTGNYQYSSTSEAEYYFSKGDLAIADGDIEGLKGCVMGLTNLLTPEDAEKVKGNMPGIMR